MIGIFKIIRIHCLGCLILLRASGHDVILLLPAVSTDVGSFPYTRFHFLQRYFLLERSSLCKRGFGLPETSCLLSQLHFYPGNLNPLACATFKPLQGAFTATVRQGTTDPSIPQIFCFHIFSVCLTCQTL